MLLLAPRERPPLEKRLYSSATPSPGNPATISTVSRLTLITLPIRRTIYSGSSARLGSFSMPLRLSVFTRYWSITQSSAQRLPRAVGERFGGDAVQRQEAVVAQQRPVFGEAHLFDAPVELLYGCQMARCRRRFRHNVSDNLSLFTMRTTRDRRRPRQRFSDWATIEQSFRASFAIFAHCQCTFQQFIHARHIRNAVGLLNCVQLFILSYGRKNAHLKQRQCRYLEQV